MLLASFITLSFHRKASFIDGEEISGEQLFRMTFSDGRESDHIRMSKQDEVA